MLEECSRRKNASVLVNVILIKDLKVMCHLSRLLIATE
jgi:hypothetical protein